MGDCFWQKESLPSFLALNKIFLNADYTKNNKNLFSVLWFYYIIVQIELLSIYWRYPSISSTWTTAQTIKQIHIVQPLHIALKIHPKLIRQVVFLFARWNHSFYKDRFLKTVANTSRVLDGLMFLTFHTHINVKELGTWASFTRIYYREWAGHNTTAKTKPTAVNLIVNLIFRMKTVSNYRQRNKFVLYISLLLVTSSGYKKQTRNSKYKLLAFSVSFKYLFSRSTLFSFSQSTNVRNSRSCFHN